MQPPAITPKASCAFELHVRAALLFAHHIMQGSWQLACNELNLSSIDHQLPAGRGRLLRRWRYSSVLARALHDIAQVDNARNTALEAARYFHSKQRPDLATQAYLLAAVLAKRVGRYYNSRH